MTEQEQIETTVEYPPIEELLARIQCDELTRLKQFLPDLDFTDVLEESPQLAEYLQKQIQVEAAKFVDPLKVANAPKLNEDFSNYFVINNLPKCEEAKVSKLKGLIMKTTTKQNLNVTEENIDIPVDPATNQTYGVAFIQMNNEENARIGAALFDNFKLTKNNIFATCLLPEFERIMQTSEEFKMPAAAADLRDLNAPILDTKREQYFYTHGKNVIVNKFDKTQAQNGQPDEEVLTLEGAAEKAIQWSPKGTYMILIKADQVVFLGGEAMVPIITLPQSKVTHVKMSPCEKYVLTFSPLADVAFTVWNFQMVEIIRELPIADGENIETYKWSPDGVYLAKKFKTELKKEGTDEVKVKEGISVYELPSMQILQNSEGQKKSITIAGIKEWEWAPTRNTLIYSCFFGQDEEDDYYGDEEEKKAAANTEQVMDPRVGFMNIPSRQVIGFKDFKSKSLKFVIHPLQDYVAIINEFERKSKKCFSVELFDLTQGNNVPHQMIQLRKDIISLMGCYWEPCGRMIAVLTLSKKEVTTGINMDAKRQGIDIFQVEHDKLKGFVVKNIGAHPSDRVVDFSWSPAGEVFCTLEKDGAYATAKSIWNWYFIEEQQAVLAAEGPKEKLGKRTYKNLEANKTNKMAAEEVFYEFKKTARHEAVDVVTRGIWDKFGRFFVVHGKKGAGLFDKELRNIKIYSIFGEPLQAIEKVPQMKQFEFRPRPSDILQPKELKALKADYRKKYGKIYREEEIKQRQVIQGKVRDEKKVVRDEFLNNFFLPLRRRYEENIDQYMALWPLKDEQMAAEEQVVDHVYNYGDLQKTEKLQR